MQALDVVIESYFDGQLFKNKVWVGVVEGETFLKLFLNIRRFRGFIFVIN